MGIRILYQNFHSQKLVTSVLNFGYLYIMLVTNESLRVSTPLFAISGLVFEEILHLGKGGNTGFTMIHWGIPVVCSSGSMTLGVSATAFWQAGTKFWDLKIFVKLATKIQ